MQPEEMSLLSSSASPLEARKSSCRYFSNLLSCFPSLTKQQVLTAFFAVLAVSGVAAIVLFKAGVFGHRDCNAQAHCGGQPAAVP